MNPEAQLDVHPNAQRLAAFIEQVLPKTERQKVLAHIADCERCRQIVHQAQDAVSDLGLSAPQSASSGRHFLARHGQVRIRQFVWLPVATVLAAVLFIVVLHKYRPALSPQSAQLAVSQRFPPARTSSPKQPDNLAKDNLKPAPGAQPSQSATNPSQLSRETAARTATQSASNDALQVNGGSKSVSNDVGRAQETPVASGTDALKQTGKSDVANAAAVGNTPNAPQQNENSESAAAATHPGRRIAVLDFSDGTVKTGVQAIFGTDRDIGKGISDLLIAQLSEGGDYRIIERSAMDKIVKEQNFSNSDRADPKTAAKIGALLGVDAIVTGDVTQFGNEDKHVNVGGGGGTWWQAAGGAARVNKSKTMVEITARLVDVNTGEILASVTGHGEVSKAGLGMGGGGHDGWKGGGGALDMGGSNFQQSAIGQAVKQSVTQLATGLDEKAATLAPTTVAAAPPLDALVADASTPDVIINVGTDGGVKVGDSLRVVRVDRVIKDPATGKPLRSIESQVGTLTITAADADSAIGKFSGSGSPKVGDHVRRSGAQ